MKYAIIAAGEGSRLAQEGITVPKPLVKIGGEPLIERLIRIFCDNDATDILVICNEQATEVSNHLTAIERDGLNGVRVPLRHIVRTTPSSMHSFFELSQYLGNEPFILTTVDTIFRESEFVRYVSFFKKAVDGNIADGVMGVTDYIDDEKPLYIQTSDVDNPQITAFLDADSESSCRFISGGIYGLCPQTALKTLNRCMANGQSRMRNFQRGLIDDGFTLLAFPFSKVLDIDHATDIAKAESFIMSKKITGIFRAERFSPNSVDKDRQILQTTLDILYRYGYEVEAIFEEELLAGQSLPHANLYLSMARDVKTLAMLKGRNVLNPIGGIEMCVNRKALETVMCDNGIPCPPSDSSQEVWLKRSDGTTETSADVVFCRTKEEEDEAMQCFAARGIRSVIRQAHVDGDLVKFYGIADTDFFYTIYPSDTGRSKFGGEAINGKAHHYGFDAQAMKNHADTLAIAVCTPIYGGDAIVKADGSYTFIDFNDWPSFSPCRQEAAENIVKLIEQYV